MARQKIINPGFVKGVIDALRPPKKKHASSVKIALVIQDGAEKALLSRVKDAFVPQSANALLHIERLENSQHIKVNTAADVCIIVAGPEVHTALAVAHAWKHYGVPTVMIMPNMRSYEKACYALGLARNSSIAQHETSPQNFTAFKDVPTSLLGIPLVIAHKTLAPLATWLLKELPQKKESFTKGFDFCAEQAQTTTVLKTSAINTSIAFLDMDGFEFPALFITEARMLMQLARLSRKQDTQLLFDLTLIALLGLASRSISHTLTKQLFLPQRVVKGAWAFATTWALGKLMELRFRYADEFSSLIQSGVNMSKSLLEEVSSQITRLGGHWMPVDKDAVYHLDFEEGATKQS